MTPSTLLRGSRVQLTVLTQSDLPTVIQWHQNPEFLRLFDALPAYPKTEAALTQWLDDTHKATDTFLFAVRPLDSDELIGYVELRRNPVDTSGEWRKYRHWRGKTLGARLWI